MVCNFLVHYQPPFFGYVCLPQPENYFSCFASFFLLFFLFSFSSAAGYYTFELLSALYSNFERLKISGRTFVRQKSGVRDWGDPPQSGPPKF